MYKIKEFSEVTDTPVTTLRYYDNAGLFKPASIDYFSGYRYYDEDQVETIKKINKLKDLGLSLDEIKEYLETGDEGIIVQKLYKFSAKTESLKGYLKKVDSDEYEVLEGTYEDLVINNGGLHIDNPRAIDVKDGISKYYYIVKNGKVIDDYTVVEDEDNWITIINRHNFTNEELMKKVAEKMKKDGYEYVTEICPVEMDDVIKSIKKQFKTESEIVTQAGYKFEKIKMYL